MACRYTHLAMIARVVYTPLITYLCGLHVYTPFLEVCIIYRHHVWVKLWNGFIKIREKYNRIDEITMNYGILP